MNSEELEQSLKTEFEMHLKSVLGEMKQETAEFHARIEAEFEKQKSQIAEAFKSFAARFDSERTFDAAFTDAVAQHLKLARDEGARVAASAMVEAENLGHSPLAAVPVPAPVVTEAKYDAIRDAVDDISSKDSQSTILKALVHHAAAFAPRGAFFIIKSEHFSGWKVFGASEAAEGAVRDISFPTSSDTILGAAVSSRTSATESCGGDGAFINPLEFAGGEGGVAIPLVARGRGVAVLFADLGNESGDAKVNREALETIVRVAGLTVELLASMQTAKAENRSVAAADFENVPEQSEEQPVGTAETNEFSAVAEEPVQEEFQQVENVVDSFSEPPPTFDRHETVEETVAFHEEPAIEPPPAFTEEPAAEQKAEESDFSFSDSVTYEGGFPREVSSNPFDAEPAGYGQFDISEPIASEPAKHDQFEVNEPITAEPAPVELARTENPFAEEPYPGDEIMREREVTAFEPQAEDAITETEEPFAQPDVESFSSPFAEEPRPIEPERGEMVFDRQPDFGELPVSSPFEQPREQFEPASVVSGGGFAHQVEAPVMEAPVVKAPAPRLSERNVDLPIEVPEEERRIHNDARRFARLLVSEIKLYNEKKVTEGRDASDLYDRLREAIDRSREMYDKRVQPPVAAKFDYFHYEIVNSLAEGTPEKLGSAYPGASV